MQRKVELPSGPNKAGKCAAAEAFSFGKSAFKKYQKYQLYNI